LMAERVSLDGKRGTRKLTVEIHHGSQKRAATRGGHGRTRMEIENARALARISATVRRNCSSLQLNNRGLWPLRRQ
jgi:hypothetical protein